MQLNFFSYEVVSFVIDIEQSLLARWRELTFDMSLVLVRVY